ncbi:MAG: coproporphyrinogen dehydrogenase HemZ, partial [Lachnospiraceae bacterium]|nr:coproporphyrinogen dehydrogenase HemZ [Lachnospiraceae bacterium]
MFAVDLNRANYEYDVNCLVKSFYPGEEITVLTPLTGRETYNRLVENSLIKISIYDSRAEIRIHSSLCAPSCVEVPCVNSFFVFDLKDCCDKETFKRDIYLTLSKATGKTLPWGNLTGIRPTKLMYNMLLEGFEDSEIKKTLQDKYFISDEKLKLGLDIAKRERKLLSGIHYKDGYSLYVGIPFCPTTCLYCSFTSFPLSVMGKYADRYIDCVIKELDLVSSIMKGKIL